MSSNFTRRFVTAALVAMVVIVIPAEAAGRRRAAAHPSASNPISAPEITGTVLDEVTGQPVAGVKVRVGNKQDTSESNGAFKVKNVTSYQGKIIVEAERTGYATRRIELTTGGVQTITIRVAPTPTVHLRKTNGTTLELDYESAEFGYPVVFSGYNSATYDEFCKSNGTAVTLDRTQIRRIIGPATMVTQSSCCAERQVQKITAELRSGETTDLFFVDTCQGIPGIEFIARNHVTAKIEYTKFADIAEIVFP
ncbi:MAG TPA: carboxypeptidase regulatory-like domain-containing protein [Thermoanaerobaculia bacterium]|nr:carboxypeptidase regulatory-like domain-containing protein [Thermoanaerobaculia bacterium]